jgi:hypothetical protein
MTNNRYQKRKLIALTFLFMMIMTSYFAMNFSGNTGDIESNSNNTNNQNNTEINKIPKLSELGEAEWWDDSFYYRKMINITNPETTTLYNFTTSIVFNYQDLVSEGKMQSDLDDIRIVENGTLRKYYIKKDFNNTRPQNGIATVYFKTTVFASSSHNNVYLYYGNSTIGKAQGYYLNTNFGLISRWDFEDGTGSTTASDSIEDNDGSLTNMDPDNDWVSGEINDYALDFDGSNDYVRVDDDSSLTVTTGLTISFRAFRQSSDTWELAVGNGGGWSENGYHVMGSSSRRYRFEIQNRTGTVQKEILDTASTVPNNQWVMITAVYDGQYMSFYIGEIQDIKRDIEDLYSEGRNNVYYIGDSSNDLHIGWHNYGPSYFDGYLDDVRIYNYALTDDEISWIYRKYTLETKLNEEQGKKASVKVIAKDKAGIPVVNANVTLVNKSLIDPILDSKLTDSDGSVIFEDLEIGEYNFSVYLSSNIIDYTVLINETSEPYLLQGLYREITLECNVGTNIFEIKDIDGLPLESGWVEVGNTTNGFGRIQKCEINETGYATFQWLYDEYPYNYTVKYQDINYNPQTVNLAYGSLSNPNLPELVFVNFTTVNFTVQSISEEPVSGAKISLNRYDHPGISIVNLTTDENGRATLRWFNSSGLEPGEIVNYSMKLFFFGAPKNFNTTTGGPPTEEEFNFTLSSATKFDFRFTVDLTDFTTDIVLLSPDSIDVTWGSELKIRSLFNITKAGEPNVYPLGPAYADFMSYRVIRQSITILSDNMDIEQNNVGRYHSTIDTSSLEGGKSYRIDISAQKSGFTIPSPETIILTVLKNEIQLNQSENDDSATSVYWLESASMSVKPYGENIESFMIEDEIFIQENNGDYNFEFSIPDLDAEWNLTGLIFNIEGITFGNTSDYIDLTIADVDNGKQYVWTNDNRDNGTYYYAPSDPGNGSWSNLLIGMNKGSIRPDNGFNFRISGTFIDAVDITTIATFTRNKIEVEYVQHNVTDAIIIHDDANGWAIQNITFELSNCYDPSTWTEVNPKNVIENITVDGYVFDYIYDAGNGYGKININNTIIYAVDNQFVFSIGNISALIFDVVIKVDYIQGIYINEYLETFNLTIVEEDYNKNDDFIIIPDEFNWIDQGALLIISDINDGTNFYSPSEINLNVTIDGITYYFEEYGTLLLNDISGFSKDTPIPAFIQTSKPVNFTLRYSIDYLRIVTYEMIGDVSYQIVEAPSVQGSVPYLDDLEYYQITIDTSIIDADEYTVRFTVDIVNYDSGQKDLDLYVLERNTLINGRSGAYQSITSLIVQNTRNFTFTYIDQFQPSNLITNLDVRRYEWEYYGEGSTILQSGTGELIVDNQNNYILDFNTENRPVGSYSIIVTLGKKNYETKIGIISLNIEKREFDYDLGNMFDDKQVNVVKGKTITLEIELIDPDTDRPIEGAKVVLEIGDDDLEFDDEGDGIYELEFDTEDYEAFFTSNTITGTIKVSKANYTTEEIDITIVIEMEEFIEGIPIFYFIMIVGAIVAVVGSLATYRVIQVARIPKFVKKARAMKGAIKNRKGIPESSLTKSKGELILEEFSNEWDEIGISLRNTLGIKPKSEKLKNEGGEA